MVLAVRDIRPTDHDSWASLFTMYRAHLAAPSEEEQRVLAQTWSWILDASDPTRGLVATDGAVITGFAHFRTYGRPSDARTVIQLEDLFTSPEHRGRGVARALIERLRTVRDDEGHALVRWTTEPANVNALHLYDQLAGRSSRITFDMVR